MNVTCPQCQKKYTLPDDRVRGRTVNVPCRVCHAQMVIEGPAVPDEQTVMLSGETVQKILSERSSPDVPWEEASVPKGPVPAENVLPVAHWFAVIRGEQVGPMSSDSLVQRIRTQDVNASTYLWRAGMAQWMKAADIDDIARFLDRTPRAKNETSKAVAPSLADTGNVKSDPFSKIHDTNPSLVTPMGEATRFFMVQAGMNRRNPPWKIALFASAAIGLPLALLYLLSTLNIGPLQVTRVDEQGREVKYSVFSKEGVAGLADILTGKGKKKQDEGLLPPATKESRPKTPPSAPAKGTGNTQAETPSSELAALYADSNKKSVGPVVRKDVEEKSKNTAQEGLSEKAVSQAYLNSQSAMQQCIEQELRKNPNFRGGRVELVLWVAPSGIVTRAKVDRPDIDGSNLGACLKSRAKKMVFPSFAGSEETEVQIPLILGASL